MSGFFKKLFNRITGKKEEAPPPSVEEAKALPTPELGPAVVEVPPPPAVEIPEPVKAKVEPTAKKPEAKKPELKIKPEAKKHEPKKPEAKAKARPDLKKAEAKKPAAKKPEPKKADVRKPEPKKTEVKKPETIKLPVKKPEAKKSDARQPEPAKHPPVAKLSPEPRREFEKPAVVVPPRPKPAPVAPPEPVIVAEQAPDRRPEEEPAVAVPPTPEPAPVAPPEPIVVAKRDPVAQPEPISEPVAERKGWFSRLKEGLSKSSKSISGSITSIFTKRRLDKATLEELEDVLIQADLGLPMAERIIKEVSVGRFDKEIEPEEVKRILASEVAKVLKPVEVPFNFGDEKPFVILVVGVNGSGKTTTIGKLGAIATGEGYKVMFAACDTFRAAAIEQLTVWGQRIGAKTISRPTGADSSGLAFDAMNEAREDGADILFIDTAGRLQNKAYLMDELDKVVRVIKKQDEAAPHAVLLVLDATTGQNAISQAEVFTKVAGVTGLIMTKLDGTARGGILVAIAEKFKLPVHAIGVGEQIDDLQPFDADAFARAIAGLEDLAA